MKYVLREFASIHGLMAVLFALAATMLIVIATHTGWVALAIEGLVAAFRASHEGPELLLYSAALVTASGALPGCRGMFERLDRYAEALEPEAMAQARKEDRKLEQG